MNPAPIDYARAKQNPWGLAAKQCMVLRLYCEHGCTKRVASVIDISPRNIEHHLLRSRKLMGLFGNDIRLYVNWTKWLLGKPLTDGLDSNAESVQNSPLATQKETPGGVPGVSKETSMKKPLATAITNKGSI